MARSKSYPASVDPGMPVIARCPSGWVQRRFGELLRPVARPVALDPDTEYTLVNAKRSRGGIVLRDRKLGSDVKVPTQFIVREGDFVISRRQIIHGACGIVPAELDGAVVSNEYLVLNSTDALLTKYLSYFSHTPYFQRTCFHSSVGVDVEKMVFKEERWFQYPLPLPPLPEQKKIAAVLSSVDAAIEKTEAVIAQLQVVKKAMMEQLLTKGLPGRHTRFKQTELGEIPEEWEVVPIGDLCEVITKGATPKGFCSELDGGIPFLRVQNISRSGYLDLSHSAMFITHQDHTGELQRSQIRPGDVLMNIVGPPLGKIAIVPPSLPQANINQAIAVLRPTKVESAYLALCLQADHLFGWALRQAKRTSSQLNLTLESCRCFPIPLPTATERAQLIAVCAAMQSLNDSTQSELAALHEIKSSLSSSLLSGELRVPTDSVPCPV